MSQTSRAGVEPWVGDGTGQTQGEIILREIPAVIGAVMVGVLRVADAVVEAWPLPGSRVRR